MVSVFLLQLSQALKRDVVNTVFNRVEMLLEDLHMNERGKNNAPVNLGAKM